MIDFHGDILLETGWLFKTGWWGRFDGLTIRQNCVDGKRRGASSERRVARAFSPRLWRGRRVVCGNCRVRLAGPIFFSAVPVLSQGLRARARAKW